MIGADDPDMTERVRGEYRRAASRTGLAYHAGRLVGWLLLAAGLIVVVAAAAHLAWRLAAAVWGAT